MGIFAIYRQNKFWIIFTYLLILVEFGLFALMPHLLGKAIDSLIANDFLDFWIYSIISTGALLLGIYRRRFDSRIFNRIWQIQVISSIATMRSRTTDSHKIISRYRLVHTYSDFFESTLPATISAMVEIIVAVIMLWLVLDWILTLCLIGLILIAMVIYYKLAIYTLNVEKRLQMLREKTDQSIINHEDNISYEIDQMRQGLIKRSDLDALGWGTNDMLWSLCEIGILFFIIQSGMSVGTVMSTIVYLEKLFSKTGILSFYFNHMKQLSMVDEILDEQ